MNVFIYQLLFKPYSQLSWMAAQLALVLTRTLTHRFNEVRQVSMNTKCQFKICDYFSVSM